MSEAENNNNNDTAEKPQFWSDRNVETDLTLPEGSYGVYRKNRTDPNQLTRLTIFTPEGFVPPVPKSIVADYTASLNESNSNAITDPQKELGKSLRSNVEKFRVAETNEDYIINSYWRNQEQDKFEPVGERTNLKDVDLLKKPHFTFQMLTTKH